MATKAVVTLAFDVYGTLIDTHGVVSALQTMVGDRAVLFSQTWRDKQLEYSFRRGLMQRYENFAVCTRQALTYTCQHLGVVLHEAQCDELMAVYRVLPAFADVPAALAGFQQQGHSLYAFSNGTAAAVEGLLDHAGIHAFFQGVVSVDGLQTFKPSPAVYQYFLRESGASSSEAWLVSSNPFDVIGAMNVGMQTAWVQRSPRSLFDPWGVEPTLTVNGLEALLNHFAD